jgi:adenylate cyclase
MARLVLTTPEGQETVTLAPRNTLGRHPSNTIQLLDKIVSKEHCVIVQNGNEFVLQDLGSLNGTFINGERVAGERALRDGDELALGSTRAVFHLDLSRVPAPAPSPASGTTRQWPYNPSSQPHAPSSPVNQPSYVGRVTEPDPEPVNPVVAPTGWKAGPGEMLPIASRPAPGTQPMAAFVPGTPPTRLDAARLEPTPRTSNSPSGAPRETLHRTRVDLSDTGRSIGNQVDATRGFQPYRDIANNPTQLAADYERLRFSHELSREIALERELTSLLNKILSSVFRLIRADRGVIFLKDETGQLVIGASLRRDGSSDAISVSSTILEHVMKERATVLTHDAAMDFAGSKGKSMILNRISSAIVAPLLHNDELLGVLWLDSETLAQFQARDLDMVSAIAAQAAMFIEISILGKKVEQEIVARERFSRLLSPNVAEKVLSGEMVIKRGGQAVDCTVFNSDIRGFTPMSERMAPEQLVEILNEYFELMVESIFKFEGTLDKFMGDGIMALWGAPVAHPDDAYRAVCSAMDQMRLLEQFNAERASRPDHVPLQIGVGIHTGRVVAGYIGSSKALSYTVIGDTANTSARLCGVAGPGQILVSEETLQQLGGRFEYRELPPTQLKGKERPFKVFEILQHARQRTPLPTALDRTPAHVGVKDV